MVNNDNDNKTPKFNELEMKIEMNKVWIESEKVNEVNEVKSNIANLNLESDLDMKIDNLPKIYEGIYY
jgi:hypothetical protein